MGLGYTWVLTGIAAIRELLGNGTILNFQVLPDSYQPILFFVLPPGGFFVFTLFIALNLFLKSRLRDPAASATAKAVAETEEGFGCFQPNGCKPDKCTACGSNGGKP
jgi:electron transport complex protein RnfE